MHNVPSSPPYYLRLLAEFGAGGLRAITPRAIDAIVRPSGLSLVPVKAKGDIPAGPGAYVLAVAYDGPTFYTGSGSGERGLSTRLGSYLSWSAQIAAAGRPRLEDPLEADSLARAGWSSMPRAVWDYNLSCWALGTPYGEAKMWEARLQQANRILSGNPMFFGGSAWEVTGELASAASDWAWDRLSQMRNVNEKV